MRPGRPARAFCALVAVACAACCRDAPAPAPGPRVVDRDGGAPATPPDGRPSDRAAPAAPSQGDARDAWLLVLDPGRPPHEVLRYAFREGARSTLDVESGGTSAVRGSDARPFGTRRVLEVEVAQVAPDGSATIRFGMRDARPGESVSRVAIATIAQGTVRVTARGRASPPLFEVVRPSDGDPQSEVRMRWGRALVQAFELLWPELPERPVGPGARWRHVGLERLDYLAVTHDVEVELLERRGSTAVLRLQGNLEGSRGEDWHDLFVAGTITGDRTLDLSGVGTRASTAAELYVDSRSLRGHGLHERRREVRSVAPR